MSEKPFRVGVTSLACLFFFACSADTPVSRLPTGPAELAVTAAGCNLGGVCGSFVGNSSHTYKGRCNLERSERACRDRFHRERACWESRELNSKAYCGAPESGCVCDGECTPAGFSQVQDGEICRVNCGFVILQQHGTCRRKR